MLAVPLLAAPMLAATSPAAAATARQLQDDSDRARERMYRAFPRTRDLVERAEGVLMFPRILKAGLLIGGQTGDGELRVKGRILGYYRLVAASWGLQAGAQQYSMAMFFMNERALRYLDESDGWQVGSGPSFVVADHHFARSVTTTSITQDVVVLIFGQSGVMAGLGVEGSKISRISLD
jgi:lipid-binding SYLF domain-containing protein